MQAAQKVPGEELFGSERCKRIGIVRTRAAALCAKSVIGAQLSNGQVVTFDNAPMILASRI